MARRELNVFSLSFLDVMSCGFGAVILIFLIINHSANEDADVINKDLLSEVRLLDYQVQEGEDDLFELKELLDEVLQRLDESNQQLLSSEERIERQKKDLSDVEDVSLAKRKSLEELESDVQARVEELKRLQALKDANAGNQARSFAGEGDRQYLTGLRIGGKHILIAVDSSASMLDNTIINVLRRRNMSEERQRQAPKWQRAIRTVEWIMAQLPLEAEFQVVHFNTETKAVTGPTVDAWYPASNQAALNGAVRELQQLVPSNGTSLDSLFTLVGSMSPLPDNLYLIVDSLPTQGEREPRKSTISGRERMDFFNKALAKLPKQVPVNVIMFPMEGDPMASASYWNVARTTGGSFISPSRDWP